MSYLDYAEHHWNDTSDRTRLKDAIADARNAVSREMYGARAWKGREGGEFRKKAIANQVRRARAANHELVGLLREWSEMEAAS